MQIDQQIYNDGKYWTVTMLTSAYACIEMVDNPKVSKMIRL